MNTHVTSNAANASIIAKRNAAAAGIPTPPAPRTIDLVMSATYLYISSFTACILAIDKYHAFCFYKVSGLVALDFALHHSNIYKMRPDMYLHHIYVVCFLAYFVYHISRVAGDAEAEEARNVLRVLLCTEVSTIFYSINNISVWFRRRVLADPLQGPKGRVIQEPKRHLMQEPKRHLMQEPKRHLMVAGGLPDWAVRANGACFAAVFFYTRIYNFYTGLLARDEFHALIRHTTRGPEHTTYFMGAIYGLFILNLYWSTKIVEKVFLGRKESRHQPATKDI